MTLPLRKAVFWIHLAVGVTAGIVILIMSVTGVLLMYERQITEWADRGYRSAPPSPGATRLPVEVLIEKVREAQPSGPAPSSIALQADSEAPAAVSLGRGRSVYINPYTGEILGEGSKKIRAFFRAVTDWHRWLGAGDENRDRARAVTGACNLGFLFLVVSGVYLWVPRVWTRRQLRNVTWFRRGLGGKARDFNWHNVFGLWAAIPLFFVVLSGVIISYPWASNLLFRVVGEAPPERRGPGGGERGGREEGDAVPLQGLDRLWVVAEQQVPGWQSISLRLPTAADAPMTFTIYSGHRGRPDLRGQLTLDRERAEIVRWEPYSSQTRGQKLRAWFRWVHTGEAGGLLGQTLAGIASAGGALLVWTGLSLAWRRFFPGVSLRRRERHEEERAEV
ncbi:MAG TPA: PepSY-associated TM helix domain-containing protein [Thermoanaerobaculia bacterium]|nr:PepSY-associated TM helix domain-containing protein [Thermoanaerobaculia bacterium]